MGTGMGADTGAGVGADRSVGGNLNTGGGVGGSGGANINNTGAGGEDLNGRPQNRSVCNMAWKAPFFNASICSPYTYT